ncbi:DUF885 domain-containing protein [Myxococcota bacterium]|nr:DUF885 domain-containing protein [Myxococcota bacterium]
MKWIKRALALLAVLLVLAAGFLVPTLFGKPWSIQHFYLRVLVQAVFDDPLVLTQLRLFESVGLHFHADDLPDQTLALRQKQAKRALEDLATLESYDTASFSAEDKLSYDVMHWLLSLGARGAKDFLDHGYAFSQLDGLHVRFPDVMVNYHLIERASDARDYVARVRKIGGALDDLFTTAEEMEKRGFTIPRFILEKVEKDARAFADKPLAESTLFTDFRGKLDKITLDDAERTSLVAELEQALASEAIPGYRRFADRVAAMIPRAPTDAGVWHFPRGDEFYGYCVEMNTSTTRTPEDIHQTGLAEVARIEGEIGALLAAQGITVSSTVTLGDTLRRLAADPKYLFPDTPEGKKAIIARYEEMAREAEAKLDGLFLTNPKAKLAIEPVPEFKEKTAPGAYYSPETLDGSKAGTFFANVRDVKEHPRWGMRTLVHHEAIPGHHFQISIARAQKHLPMFRQLVPLTAYAEGWALYAEQLADEHGYLPEPLDRLGYLDAQLFRAVRLVVDTGLHAKRWTREEAIQYMLAHTGSSATEVETEIERYIVWPGQALGYMVGRLELLALRARAKAALGESFDLRAFHDAVLLPGALPLSLLSQEVDRWVDAKKKPSS